MGQKVSNIFKVILILIVINSFATEMYAQCKQSEINHCYKDKTSIYLKDFIAKFKARRKKEDNNTWSIVLTKGTIYEFQLCGQVGLEDKFELVLYDKSPNYNVKPIKTTLYSNEDNKFQFRCNKSGLYYMRIRFIENEEKQKGCAVGKLLFVSRFKSHK